MVGVADDSSDVSRTESQHRKARVVSTLFIRFQYKRILNHVSLAPSRDAVESAFAGRRNIMVDMKEKERAWD
jgi:hypothetical protein